jgi:hypothetical protein
MDKQDGGPAFPCTLIDYGSGPTAPDSYGLGGMALRDYFAGQALIGFLTKASYPDGRMPCAHDMAVSAFTQADAMIAERDK